jgi:hypothetical protein
VHPLAGTEQLDVEIRDGRIRLPDLLLAHRRDYTSSRPEPNGPALVL